MCFDIIYIFVRNIFHFKKNWARYDKKYLSVFMLSTGYSGQILVKLENLLDRFSKNTQSSDFMKIRLVGAELFHAERQTLRS